MFEKFKANRIRHKGIRRAEKDLQNSGKTGLALYDFVQEYTGDPNPWIKNPYGFFSTIISYSTLHWPTKEQDQSRFCIAKILQSQGRSRK